MTREIHEENWAVFCRVIDNHGDIGFAWRLATQLAACGQRVDLFLDDASALSWMAPDGNPKVTIKPWPLAHDEVPVEQFAQVVIEVFGCELPSHWQAAMAAAIRVPVWVNLEYFSAQRYASQNHGLPSPILSGPAKGLTKWFFYPGIDEQTGGLLAGPKLNSLHRRSAVSVSNRLRISVFCYEPAGMALWLSELAQLQAKVELYVTAGRATRAVQLAWQTLPKDTDKLLSVNYLAHMPQDEYDVFLSSMDLNLVRGEDSLVRAMHAGKPFLWQIYPQHDGAHVPKLHAFLKRTQA
ncbi:MAG: elongation factor P maturation arginine rhamnosyltransferase EarP, partial [Limnohabitans sp.]